MRVGHAWVGLAIGLGACEPSSLEVASSASLVLDGARGSVWVTSPDDDAVVELSPADGTELRRVAVVGGPEQMAWVRERLVVSLARDHEMAVLDPAVEDVAQVEVARIATPCGGTAGVVGAGAMAFVACPSDDRVLEVDVAAARVRRSFALPGRPTGMARRGRTILVTLARTGAIAAIDADVGSITMRSVSLPRGVFASQLSSVGVSEHGAVHALYQRVEADADRERDPSRGGYGSVVDGAPRIEPRLDGPCGDRYARFDGGALAMSGPSAVAARGGWLWITHQYTDNVLLARCDESGTPREGALEVFATFRVGRGPRGVALSEDGRTAFVDVGFDWALARLDAPEARTTTVIEPTFARRRERGPSFLSDEALRGRSLFFDAVDTHLTPSGVVTCGTCHPSGGEDGLAWFLHTTGVPRKLRRTPPAWAARASLAPFHWDGEFTDAALLARTTTRELMQGDGLLVDFDDIAAFMSEAPPPPPRPVDDATRASVARGAELFVSSGCVDCHVEALRSDGARHDVLPPAADADALLASVNTPALAGARARAPYFHDGRARTLRDTVSVPDDTHGRTSELTPEDLDDLVAYLESL